MYKADREMVGRWGARTEELSRECVDVDDRVCMGVSKGAIEKYCLIGDISEGVSIRAATAWRVKDGHSPFSHSL